MAVKTEKQVVSGERDVVVAVVCNCCGGEEHPDVFNGIHVQHTFSYFSRFFGDMTQMDMHICESCLDKIFQSCAIKPEIKSLIF